ncbi:MAG: lipopolysaccharide biosynthesis protein [Pseudomonadota bacterium]
MHQQLIGLLKGPVARGAISSIALRVIGLAIAFLQSVLAARVLGAEGFGIAAVALSTVLIASTLASLGFGPLSVREIAQRRERDDDETVSTFMAVSMISAIAVAMVIAGAIATLGVFGEVIPAGFRDTVAAALPMIPLLAFAVLTRGQAQGFGRVVVAQLPGDLLRPAIISMALAAAYLGWWDATPATYMLVSCLAILVGCLFSAVALRYLATARPRRPHAGEAAAWHRAAAPFLGIAALSVIGTEASTLILAAVTSPEEVGLFQPIIRLVPLMLLTKEAIVMPLGPRLAAAWARGDHDQIKDLTRKAALAATTGTVATVGALLLVAPLILGAFGRDFLVNQHLLLWIGLAQIVGAMSGPASLLLDMAARMRERTIAQIITVGVQLSFGAVLASLYGSDGAAAAIIATILAWNVFNWHFARQRLGVDTSLLSYAELLQRRGERPGQPPDPGSGPVPGPGPGEAP